MNRDEILKLLQNTPNEELFARADTVRLESCGDMVYIRAIIEYSNYCRCLCHYCGLNAQNTILKRYRMTIDQILETAREAFNEDVRTVVLQAGEDPGFPIDDICLVCEGIKKIGDIAITLSSGEYSRNEYRLMRRAGADRYLLKIETTNRELYKKLHPGCSFDNRIRCLHDLKELDYQLGSGSLVGLPGQTFHDIANDISFCVDFDLEMATISPFIPHPDTPLGNEPGGTSELGLRALAVTRIAMPLTHIPCSTALATITPDDYLSGLKAGANVIMADVTPFDVVRFYDLYPGKAPKGPRKGRDSIARIKSIITSVGRSVAEGRGDSLKRPR